MDLESLMNVEVTTASRFEDKITTAPAIMSVVTSDELRRFGGITLAEVLDRVPGLTRTSQYFTDRSLIAARGDQTKTAGGHILFLINGRPTREVMEGGIISDLLESFPIQALERIEIIKGPGSVLYGSNAFSAVINLITRKAEGNQATVTALGGAGGALSSSLFATWKRGDLSVVAASQIHDAPDWPITYHVPPAEQDLSFAPHVPAVQNVDVVDRGSGSFLGANYKDFSFESAFTEWQSTAFVQGTVGETRMTRAFGNLGYDHKVTANWDMNFNLTYTRTTFSEVQYPSALRDSNEFIAEWTNLITLSSRDRLTAGALFNRIAGEEDFTGTSPYTVSAEGSRPGGAFYAQIDHQLFDDVKLVGGFQTNKIGDLALDTVPRGGLTWTPSSWAGFKVLYGQAFRAPALDELLLNRPGIVGNPNLLPEKVGTFDVGFTAQWNRIQAGVDYFHSKQTDSIVSVTGTPSRYMNLGELTFDGFELEGKYYLRKNFFLQGSLLYQTNVSGTGASNVTPIPTTGYKAGVSYEGRHGLRVGVFDISDGPISGYANSVNPVQGWHNIIDGQLRYDLSKYLPFSVKRGVAFVAHVNNLLNTPVWLPGWGFNSVDTIPVQQGRVVYAGFEFSTGRN
jgi:outer membrane receptor protein involved in Fe transport